MLDSASATVLAAVFNLNHPAHTVDWHFIHLSVANVVVIGVMFIVFFLAILLPFPGAAKRRRGSSGVPRLQPGAPRPSRPPRPTRGR